MIKILRIDHIQLTLPPNQEEEARKFYGDILGLEEIEKPTQLRKNGGLWYKIGDIQLHLGIEEKGASSKQHPAFEVKSLSTIKNFMQQKAIPIKEEIPIPGVERFSFRDPFDNRIEFLEKKIN